MRYGELRGGDSVGDIEKWVRGVWRKVQDCGISYGVGGNSVGKGKEKGDWDMYKDFGEVVLKKVGGVYVKEKLRLEVEKMVYGFDRSSISVCVKLCGWGKYGKKKGGMKMERLVDLGGNVGV